MPKELTEDFLRKEFVDNKKSTSQIAKELGTHANTIRRLLIKYKIPLRNKSEAQALALKNNTAKHPTQGKSRSPEEIEKISKATYDYWQNIDDEEKSRWSKMKKEQWEKLSDSEKERKSRAAAVAVRRTNDEGSKLEKHLCEELRNLGYRVELHRENFLLNTRLQTDLLLPTERVVIEVDGISHYKPIFGDEKLRLQRRADAEKNGLLIANGFHVVRLKAVYKTLAKAKMKEYLTLVLDTLKSLKNVKSPTVVNIGD